MVELALPGQQSVVPSVSWVWNSSFLARSDPKNIGKGLRGAPSLEGFNRVDVAPRSVVDPWQCWGNSRMGTGNFPTQTIPDSLSQGLGAASGGGIAKAEPRVCTWLTQGGPGGPGGSVPPRTGTPWSSGQHRSQLDP